MFNSLNLQTLMRVMGSWGRGGKGGGVGGVRRCDIDIVINRRTRWSSGCASCHHTDKRLLRASWLTHNERDLGWHSNDNTVEYQRAACRVSRLADNIPLGSQPTLGVPVHAISTLMSGGGLTCALLKHHATNANRIQPGYVYSIVLSTYFFTGPIGTRAHGRLKTRPNPVGCLKGPRCLLITEELGARVAGRRLFHSLTVCRLAMLDRASGRFKFVSVALPATRSRSHHARHVS